MGMKWASALEAVNLNVFFGGAICGNSHDYYTSHVCKDVFIQPWWMEQSSSLTVLLFVFKESSLGRETEEGAETSLCKICGFV